MTEETLYDATSINSDTFLSQYLSLKFTLIANNRFLTLAYGYVHWTYRCEQKKRRKPHQKKFALEQVPIRVSNEQQTPRQSPNYGFFTPL